MKKKLTMQIASAALAVIFAAGIGTAALASGEPSGDSRQMTPPAAQQQTQTTPGGAPAQQDRQPVANSQPASGEQNAPAGQSAPDRQAAPESAGSDAAASHEMTVPLDGEGQDAAAPGEDDAPEAGDPSGEPSDEPSGEPSDEPSGEPAPDEETDGERPAPGGGQGQPAQQPQGGFMSSVRTFFEDLFRQFMSLFGFGGNTAQQPAAQPASPADQQSGEGEPSAEPGASGEPSSEPTSYTAANTLTEDSAGASYASASGDENAVLVSGDTVTLSDVTVTKTGSSTGESADFYGVNAGILAANGATLTIENASVTTDGAHANGVFSYGSGTTVNISDSVITTSASNSGGIMTTGGAALNATNLTVSTSGSSSAAIRSDRGGGTVTVSEGSYATSGVGSPAIYSTADITVSDAALTSTASEAVVIEGGNSVTLLNDAVSGNNARLNGQSTVKTNVLIYQSMSGDAAEGSSTFTMTGGSMTAGTGAMFHVTNVTTEINLSAVDFTYASDSSVFLDASADAWGTTGRNGGNVTLNLDAQDIVGIITTDSVSTVAVHMANGSTWTLTGDGYITSLSGDTTGIDLNGYTLYVNGVAYTA